MSADTRNATENECAINYIAMSDWNDHIGETDVPVDFSLDSLSALSNKSSLGPDGKPKYTVRDSDVGKIRWTGKVMTETITPGEIDGIEIIYKSNYMCIDDMYFCLVSPSGSGPGASRYGDEYMSVGIKIETYINMVQKMRRDTGVKLDFAGVHVNRNDGYVYLSVSIESSGDPVYLMTANDAYGGPHDMDNCPFMIDPTLAFNKSGLTLKSLMMNKPAIYTGVGLVRCYVSLLLPEGIDPSQVEDLVVPVKLKLSAVRLNGKCHPSVTGNTKYKKGGKKNTSGLGSIV